MTELVEDVLHLDEAELEVDELLDEHVLGGGDGLVFLEEVVDGCGCEVGVAAEVVVVAHGVEAVLEGVGGGAGLACRGSRAGRFLGIGAVGGEGGFGHGLGAFGLVIGSLGGGWQRTLVGVGS